MDATPCAICAKPIPYKSGNYKTCGHPRCVRTYRAESKRERERGAVKSTRRLAEWQPPDQMAPDTRGRINVTDAWDSFYGIPESQRVYETARRAGESVAVTISVLRAAGRL